MASQTIIPGVNAAVTAAANTYGWTLVRGISADFLRHGYPSTTPWIVTLEQSVNMESNQDGTFHPNAVGHQDIAVRLLDTYLGLLGTPTFGQGRLGRNA